MKLHSLHLISAILFIVRTLTLGLPSELLNRNVLNDKGEKSIPNCSDLSLDDETKLSNLSLQELEFAHPRELLIYVSQLSEDAVQQIPSVYCLKFFRSKLQCGSWLNL